MATLGNLIDRIAKSIGIENEDSIKQFLSNVEVTKVEVPDEVYKGVGTKLLSIKAAENSDDLRDHFFSQFASGGSAKLTDFATELGVDPEEAKSIFSEKTSIWNRTQKLVNKVKELEASKAGSSKGDKKLLEDEITKLNAQIAKSREEMAQAIAQKEQEFTGRLTDIEIDKMLTRNDYFYEDQPLEVNKMTALNLTNRKLAENKYKFVFDNEKKSVVLKTEGGSDVFVNNSPLSANDFITSVVTENKLIKLSGNDGQKRQQQQAQQQVIVDGLKPNEKFLAEADKALSDYNRTNNQN